MEVKVWLASGQKFPLRWKEASAYPHANSSYGNGISHKGTAHPVSTQDLECIKVVHPEQLRDLTNRDQGE